MAPDFIAEDLEKAFQHEVLKMLKKEGKINDAIIENLLSWHHSGFHVYIGGRILPGDETGLEKLAKHIIRACFSQEGIQAELGTVDPKNLRGRSLGVPQVLRFHEKSIPAIAKFCNIHTMAP